MALKTHKQGTGSDFQYKIIHITLSMLTVVICHNNAVNTYTHDCFVY